MTPRTKRACGPRAHPLAQRFFEIAQAQNTGVSVIAQRAGLCLATLVKWKYRHAPTVAALEAALNVLGYELRVVRRRDLPTKK